MTLGVTVADEELATRPTGPHRRTAARSWRRRQLPNSWTTVTATGIASGDSTIRKMMIGNSMALLTFSALRNRRFVFPGKNSLPNS